MNEASKISKMFEDKISEALIKAVQNLSIEIDEEELLKRLRDSKEQYRRGYEDREQEIVRCKDCKYCGSEIRNGIKSAKCELKHNWMPQPDWFCADGERRETE